MQNGGFSRQLATTASSACRELLEHNQELREHNMVVLLFSKAPNDLEASADNCSRRYPPPCSTMDNVIASVCESDFHNAAPGCTGAADHEVRPSAPSAERDNDVTPNLAHSIAPVWKQALTLLALAARWPKPHDEIVQCWIQECVRQNQQHPAWSYDSVSVGRENDIPHVRLRAGRAFDPVQVHWHSNVLRVQVE